MSTVTDCIQRVTVTRSGDYRIEVRGAEGGDHEAQRQRSR